MRALAFALIVACGPTARAPAPAQRTDEWAPLSFEQRHSVMTFTVLPNMARTWQTFKKTPVPEMTCRTCHGQNAEAVAYRMPNPALPPIDAAHQPQGPIADFMRKTMVPDMIDLVGTTPQHFGCNSCHPSVHKP